jgi:hypothetical protein
MDRVDKLENEEISNEVPESVDEKSELSPPAPSEETDISEKQINDSVEERKEKTKLILSIRRYQAQFGKYLECYAEITSLDYLRKLSIKQLSDLLDEIQIAVSCRSGASMINHFYFEGIKTAEVLAPSIGWDVRGLHNDLKENEAIHETLKEVSLKYESISYIDPLTRLGYLTLQSMYFKNKQNKTNSKIDNFDKTVVNDSLQEKFSDL